MRGFAVIDNELCELVSEGSDPVEDAVVDSPFEPPEETGEPSDGSWTYLGARIAVAGGVLAYSALLAAPATLGGGLVVFYAVAEGSVPVEDVYGIILSGAALTSVGVVGLGCASVLVLFRNLALPALLAFSIYAMVAVFPLAVIRVLNGQPLQEAASVIAIGSLGPMLCMMAYGLLRILKNRTSE
ncbi:MAG: hypothetical protein ACJAZO_002757 [Myxococcota bacterium]|jgi:hypothetical protein